MKKITISVTDDIADTVIKLLFDQCIAFAVEPLGEPEAPVPIKRGPPGFNPSSKLGLAVLKAGLATEKFGARDVAVQLELLGSGVSSASPALSRARAEGYIALLGKGVYTLTEKGKRAVEKL